MNAKGSHGGVAFCIPKTELIHCCTNRDRDTPSQALIHFDGSVFHPKSVLRWLGYWFTPSLATTLYFTKPVAKAQAAFVPIKRLSSRAWVSLPACVTPSGHPGCSTSSVMEGTSSPQQTTWRESYPPSGTWSRGGAQTASPGLDRHPGHRGLSPPP